MSQPPYVPADERRSSAELFVPHPIVTTRAGPAGPRRSSARKPVQESSRKPDQELDQEPDQKPPHGALGDVLTALVGVGIPGVLILTCWVSSTLLVTIDTAQLLAAVAHAGMDAATLASVTVALLFLAASCARLFASRRGSELGSAVCVAVICVWMAGSLSQLPAMNSKLIATAIAQVAWAAVANWALLKLIADRRSGATDHLLYRFRDAAGTTLYIGITNNTSVRFRQHAEKAWWPRVAVREIVHYHTRAQLVAAERKAIRKEHPLYNRQHNSGRGGR